MYPVTEELHARVDALYTPFLEAVAELERRRQDPELMRRVAEFCAGYPDLPELAEKPRFVMARALFSPNLETIYINDLMTDFPYDMIFYEFSKDKFVSVNPGKKSLACMTFYKESASGGKDVLDTVPVIDIDANEGRLMRDIKTLRGESFVDFHHRLLTEQLTTKPTIIDFSDWFKNSYFFRPELPYLRYLCSFLTNGILFENFLLDKYEYTFTMKRVLPAVEVIMRELGIKPLIVPVTPAADDEYFWSYYPEAVRARL